MTSKLAVLAIVSSIAVAGWATAQGAGCVTPQMWLADLQGLGLRGAVSGVLSLCVAQDGDVFDAWQYRFDERGRIVELTANSPHPRFSSLGYTYPDGSGFPATIVGIDSIGEGWRTFGCNLSATTLVQTGATTCLTFTIWHMNQVGQGIATYDSSGRIASVKMKYRDSQTEDSFDYEYMADSRAPSRIMDTHRAIPVWDTSIVRQSSIDTFLDYGTDGALSASTKIYTDSDGVVILQNTYAYHEFDSEGNWVRRTVKEYYRGGLDAVWDELRAITYREE